MGQPQELMFQNQLQFNLHVPLTAANMATHFRRPRPITVERVGGPSGGLFQGLPVGRLSHKGNQNDLNASSSSVQFSAVSQDKLAAAVQLAKRDVKNRKFQQKTEQRDHSRERRRSPSPVHPHREKQIHGQKYWETQGKRMGGRDRLRGKRAPCLKPAAGKVKVKEQDRNRAPYNAATQTPPTSPPRQAFLSNKTAARTNSPPTRDTPSLTKVVHVPKDDIEKLQMEMEMYLQQIESVERRALSENNTDFLKQGLCSRSCEDDLGEEEREKKRRLRTEEQGTRAARNIYNLRQQVKQIEREILTTPCDPKATRKSQAVAKLGAAHRGAVRALQAFVNQLPYQDLRSGLPSHYNELALLIRQLTMLSARIPQAGDKGKEVKAGTSPVQDDLMAMLDRVENLNADWCRETQNQDPGPKPFREKPPFVTNFKPSKEPFTVERVGKPPSQQAHRSEGDRRAWLQAGVKALVDRLATDSNRQRRPRPQKQRKAPSLTMPTRKQPAGRRGLLLPAQLKLKREQTQRAAQQRWEAATHFADPTITANLKASTLLHNPITEPRSVSAPASPRAGRKKEVNFDLDSEPSENYHASYPGVQQRHGIDHSRSPQSRLSRSLSPSARSPRSKSPRSRSRSPGEGRRRFFVQDVDSELVNDIFPSERQMYRQRQSDERKQSGRHVLRSGDVSESFVSEVERRVADRLRPLLQDRTLSQESVSASEVEDQDQLAEMILEDVMEEAAAELTEMERSRAAREKAAGLLNNPTLENVHQRLEEMEREALAIRQRWASISYHDSAPAHRYRPTVKSLSKSEQFQDPPAFEVRKLPREAEESPVKAFADTLPEEPLVFTKDTKAFRPHVKFEEHSEGLPERTVIAPPAPKPRSAGSGVLQPKTLLTMKQTVVERITDSVERFHYHQRGLKHHIGKKNPWRIVESVADQILDECFDQVAAELEEINTAMADHIYTSEFMSETGLPLAPPDLASDFVTGGTAARNLRDSAAAQHSVETAVARAEIQPFAASSTAVGEAIGQVIGQAIGEGGGDGSPPWDTSLQHVFDATELYEATAGEVTEDIQPVKQDRSASHRDDRSVTHRDEDTKAGEEDYDDDFDEEDDDDYTDLSDDVETESNRS